MGVIGKPDGLTIWFPLKNCLVVGGVNYQSVFHVPFGT